jgi:hypothetical protein
MLRYSACWCEVGDGSAHQQEESRKDREEEVDIDKPFSEDKEVRDTLESQS